MVEEELSLIIRKLVEPEDALTVETGTLHHVVEFQFICRDDGTTVVTGVCDNSHD